MDNIKYIIYKERGEERIFVKTYIVIYTSDLIIRTVCNIEFYVNNLTIKFSHISSKNIRFISDQYKFIFDDDDKVSDMIGKYTNLAKIIVENKDIYLTNENKICDDKFCCIYRITKK
jgi:hypothetical protein